MRSDLYALAVLLHEQLTGASPFSPWHRPRVFQEGPSPAAAQVILACLAKDPGDKPRSAGEVLAVWCAGCEGTPR